MTDCSRVLPEAADDNRAFTVSDAGVRTHRDFALAAAGWKAAVQASGAKAVALYFPTSSTPPLRFSAAGRQVFEPCCPQIRPKRLLND